MQKKSFLRKIWKQIKQIFFYLFFLHLFYIVLLKWVDPPITITQLVSWLNGHGLKRNYINERSVPYNAKLAVIASEDQIFADHNGFDWKSIRKALEYNKRKPGRYRGTSTISQQVAKNVFLWQGKSWFRKALEAYFTFMIEVMWGKKRILDVYLNCIEMGEGVFGIEEAARTFFHKPAKNLSRYEAATIAACLPNPKRFKVNAPSSYIEYRTQWILQQMNHIEDDPDIQKIIHDK